jgi:putative phosphoesterase
MTIGVISDTHNFFDPKIPELLTGTEHILHAGDIGTPKILLELEQIAQVTAVAGNTDDPGFRYRQMEVVSVGGLKFLVHHIVNPLEPGDALKDRLARESPDVVVFGHTHKPFCQELRGTLFFNPGYAGKSRFGMERTLAVLHCNGGRIRPEYFTL